MTQSPFAKADLFGDDDDDCSPTLRAAWASAMPAKRRRAVPLPDPESAARLLDAHDDYRVLRRLQPRPVDPAYRLGPGESIALLVDVETTGLDHRCHEVIEIGMVAFAHDAEGRIGPVVGVLGMLHEPKGEISAEITRLTGITVEMVAGQAIDIAAVSALLEPAELVIACLVKARGRAGLRSDACEADPPSQAFSPMRFGYIPNEPTQAVPLRLVLNGHFHDELTSMSLPSDERHSTHRADIPLHRPCRDRL